MLAAHPRAVVFFWAIWSPPDKMFSAVLSRVAPGFDEQFAFFAVDIDAQEGADLAAMSGISTNPALVFVQHGQPREHTIGYMNGAALRQKLSDWLVLT